MICQESYVSYLDRLPREDQECELRKQLAGTLHELVEVIEGAAHERGRWFRSCVVDDFEITRIRCTDDHCAVLLFYSASTQRGDAAPSGNKTIFGTALVSVDHDGQIVYKGVSYNEEQGLVVPDVGVGD
jgi:hypothetical protein